MTHTDTLTTAELTAGQPVRYQHETTRQGWVYEIDDEHPGTVATVVSVEPWMLTTGPKAGQQARQGRGRAAKPLFVVNLSDGANRAVTADYVWRVEPSPATFVCRSCGDVEHPVTPGDDDSLWCECGARLDAQRERLADA